MSTDSTRRRAFVDNDDVLSVAHAPGASIVTMVFSTLFSPNQMLGRRALLRVRRRASAHIGE
jgi:hypothetical protein